MITKLINGIQKIIHTASTLLLGCLTILLFVQVIMRYVIQASLSWSEELSRYMFIWVIYLGVNLGIRDEIQIRIDFLDNFFKGKKLLIIQMVRYLLSFVAVIICLISSISFIKYGKLSRSTVMQIPMWLIYYVFAIGFFLNIVEIIRKLYCLLIPKEKSSNNIGMENS